MLLMLRTCPAALLRRSTVTCAGHPPSETPEPFVSPTLHILSEGVKMVDDALDELTGPETISGYRPQVRARGRRAGLHGLGARAGMLRSTGPALHGLALDGLLCSTACHSPTPLRVRFLPPGTHPLFPTPCCLPPGPPAAHRGHQGPAPAAPAAAAGAVPHALRPRQPPPEDQVRGAVAWASYAWPGWAGRLPLAGWLHTAAQPASAAVTLDGGHASVGRLVTLPPALPPPGAQQARGLPAAAEDEQPLAGSRQPRPRR